MKNLIIVGAGGFGREMYGAAAESCGCGAEYRIRGFLDARASALDGFTGYPPILGSPEDYRVRPDDVFITALGDIAARRRCVEALESRGAKFATVVHRSAFIGPGTSVGEGSFVANNVVLTANVRIGRHSCVFHNTSIGHDSSLGDFSHVYAQCAVGGGVRICDGAVVYPGSQIVPRRTVGADAVVGVGSTVILNVPPRTTVFGSPAAPVDMKSATA